MFTIDLLTNDDVIDVSQDPLGKQASRRAEADNTEVWARPLFDGTVAVGLFNLSMDAQKVTAKWSDLGITGSQPVRDLWQKKNLGNFKDSFTTAVPAHGAILVKIGKPDRTDW
jgi:alpha-galactosidase